MSSASPAHSSAHSSTLRLIAAWLAGLTLLALAMIVLGGLTRLTQSGLSITEWKPVTGAVPPLSDAMWLSEFAKYRQIPEYQKLNLGMSLDDFKAIYWWEWSHRLLARLIGLAFAVPLLIFAVRGMIVRAMLPRLGFLFLLGAAQGALGWFMVKSGLSVRTDVSHYRLAAHLIAGFAIYGAFLWTVLDVVEPAGEPEPEAHRLRPGVLGFLGLLLAQIILGAFVAGLDAGWAYNTWPLMDGHWFPQNPGVMPPWYANLFDNRGVVQFLHRVLGYGVLATGCGLWLTAKRRFGPDSRTVRRAALLAGLLALQVILGIATLLSAVPLALGVAHQLTGALVFGAALSLLHQLTPRPAWSRQPVEIADPAALPATS